MTISRESEIGDEIEVVSIALVDTQPGDLILVHAGEAIAKLAYERQRRKGKGARGLEQLYPFLYANREC